MWMMSLRKFSGLENKLLSIVGPKDTTSCLNMLSLCKGRAKGRGHSQSCFFPVAIAWKTFPALLGGCHPHMDPLGPSLQFTCSS